MCKGINLKEHHRHSGKDCELYFVPRVEPSSISPTTLTNRGLYGDLLYFCNVHWLSRGKMLRREYIGLMREKIAIFLEKTQMLPNLLLLWLPLLFLGMEVRHKRQIRFMPST